MVKGVLNEYSTWQSLSPREGLEKFNDVQSSLSGIPSLCTGIRMPQEHQVSPKISFEMNSLSDMMGFGQLGRLVVAHEGGNTSYTSSRTRHSENGSRSDSTEPEGDLPPNKKRKTR